MVLLSRRHSLETGRNCTKTTIRRMNQFLSPHNSPSMNKQVFVLGGRSDCGHQGQRCTDSLSNSKTRHQATLCSSPTSTGGYSDIIFTDRLLGNLKKDINTKLTIPKHLENMGSIREEPSASNGRTNTQETSFNGAFPEM